MRTRRSPRNQDILFNALFPKPVVVTRTIDERIDASRALIASGRLNPRSLAAERRALDGMIRRRAMAPNSPVPS